MAICYFLNLSRELCSAFASKQCYLQNQLNKHDGDITTPFLQADCPVNRPGTGEFPAQMASNAENVSIWWRHH